jgi:hypothetical protein
VNIVGDLGGIGWMWQPENPELRIVLFAAPGELCS